MSIPLTWQTFFFPSFLPTAALSQPDIEKAAAPGYRKHISREEGMAEDFLHFMAAQAERRIQAAQKEGAFDHLPGEGKPLDFEDDSTVPGELRMAYKVLRNAGYLPPEIADRKEINTILDLLEHCEEGAEKVRQMQKLDVILMRMQNRHKRSVAITEHDPYYENVVRRITILKKGRS